MSKKLWDWFYLKPVDHLDILRSENIDKGRKMHEAISKRMKELIASGPPLKFVGPTTPICFEHFVDDIEKVECDCEVKILKNRTPIEPTAQWSVDSEAKFDENMIKDLHVVGFSKLKKEISEIQNNLTENKSPQVSICSSCNYYNEWIPFDSDYKCYKCKKGL